MHILLQRNGTLRFIYSETVNLSSLGIMQIERVSHVEPDAMGRWHADLSPVAGPVLGPFALRSEAVSAELTWLHRHWLAS